MEFAKVEVDVVQETVKQSAEKQFRDLADLQLAYLGGGIGEVIIA